MTLSFIPDSKKDKIETIIEEPSNTQRGKEIWSKTHSRQQDHLLNLNTSIYCLAKSTPAKPSARCFLPISNFPLFEPCVPSPAASLISFPTSGTLIASLPPVIPNRSQNSLIRTSPISQSSMDTDGGDEVFATRPCMSPPAFPSARCSPSS